MAELLPPVGKGQGAFTSLLAAGAAAGVYGGLRAVTNKDNALITVLSASLGEYLILGKGKGEFPAIATAIVGTGLWLLDSPATTQQQQQQNVFEYTVSPQTVTEVGQVVLQGTGYAVTVTYTTDADWDGNVGTQVQLEDGSWQDVQRSTGKLPNQSQAFSLTDIFFYQGVPARKYPYVWRVAVYAVPTAGSARVKIFSG